ncbi:MAG: hypothetical protein ACE5HF_04305 [Gemmatimonadota bacterium]
MVSWGLVPGLILVHFLLRPTIRGLPVAPDLLLGALLLGAARMRAGYAALFGFGLGVLEAAFAMQGMGQLALVFTLVAYLGARSRELLFFDARAFGFLYLFVGTWAAQIGIVLFASDVTSPFAVVFPGLATAALTALVAGVAERAVALVER